MGFSISRNRLRPVTKRLPRLRKGWALIRVRLAGICNTDLEILRGYHNFHGILGHEFVGEVAAIGSNSKILEKNWSGKRVTGEINISCRACGYKPECEYCRRGLKTHCARRRVLGIVGHDGAFAGYLTLPVENLHLIPAQITDRQAVFIEPLAAACQILEQIDIRQFPSAVVLGDGKLAQLIGMALKAEGCDVTLLGKHQAKLSLARNNGIKTRKVFGDERDLKNARRKYGLVIEATGSPTGLRLAEEIVEPRGTLVLKSTFHGAAPVETWPVVVKEITVVGSRCGPFKKAISLIASGKVDPSSLVSREFPLREAAKAVAYAKERGVMKVLLNALGEPRFTGG